MNAKLSIVLGALCTAALLPADTLRRPETIAKARFLAYSQP